MISRLYSQELFFLVGGNKEDQLPPSNKVAICGVRPDGTMPCCGISRNQNYVEVVLCCTMSCIQCIESGHENRGNNMHKPNTTQFLGMKRAAVERDTPILPDFLVSLQVLRAGQKDDGTWNGRPPQIP